MTNTPLIAGLASVAAMAAVLRSMAAATDMGGAAAPVCTSPNTVAGIASQPMVFWMIVTVVAAFIAGFLTASQVWRYWLRRLNGDISNGEIHP